jgi:thermitase
MILQRRSDFASSQFFGFSSWTFRIFFSIACSNLGAARDINDATSEGQGLPSLLSSEIVGLQSEPDSLLDSGWVNRQISHYDVQELFKSRKIGLGEGVLVAHIDTGISLHPELNQAQIDFLNAFNFIDNNTNVFHRFSKYQFPLHGHGTETLTLMASPLGCVDIFESEGCISGVAPKARYLPLLVTDSSIVSDFDLMAEAIDYAVDQGAGVINISLGNIFKHPRLEAALERAHEEGVIVIAAAGNGTGSIPVYPGAYPSVIAVGGTTMNLRPWEMSSVGPHVAWSAPAKGVPSAVVREIDGDLQYYWSHSSGTSDAAAVSSGVAALWLSYHGRDKLINKFGKEFIVEKFRKLVVDQGVTKPWGWPKSGYGAGIIDAKKVIKARL